MPINNTQELRDFVVLQLERLCTGEISPETANAASMLSANVLLSVKLDMEYAKLTREKPNIQFIEGSFKCIETDSIE